MNKRQAKKAFKRKYGMNPGEAAKLLNEIDFTKVMQQVTEAIDDFTKKLPKILDGMAKTIRAAAEQIDTEQLKEYLQQYEEGRNDTNSLTNYRGYLENEVFLAKSEAEAKLEELRGKQNEREEDK